MGRFNRCMCTLLLALLFLVDVSSVSPFKRNLQDEATVNVVATFVAGTEREERTSLLESLPVVVKFEFKRTPAVALSIPFEWIPILEESPLIETVEEDPIVKAQAERVPWGIRAVQADDPFIPNPDLLSPCFKVCVVDSGVLIEHRDIPYSLADPNIQGSEFGIPAGQVWNRPQDGHGTHVMGTMIAETGNNLGVRGVIGDHHNICFLVARVFADGYLLQSESEIDRAAEWCADQGARVINMSLGSQDRSTNGARIYQSLYNEGVLVVAAVGNGGESVKNYPAGYDTVISVAATDIENKHANFSNFNDQVDISAPGYSILSTIPELRILDNMLRTYSARRMEFSPWPRAQFGRTLRNCGRALGPCVDVSNMICLIERGDITYAEKAMNCEIGGGLAAIIYNDEPGSFSGTLGYGNNISIPVLQVSQADGRMLQSSAFIAINFFADGYGNSTGTSMSTPHVSGVAAKIWAARPRCSLEQVRQALLNSTLDIGVPGWDEETGFGLLQARGAYEHLLTFPFPCGDFIATRRKNSFDDKKATKLSTSGRVRGGLRSRVLKGE